MSVSLCADVWLGINHCMMKQSCLMDIFGENYMTSVISHILCFTTCLNGSILSVDRANIMFRGSAKKSTYNTSNVVYASRSNVCLKTPSLTRKISCYFTLIAISFVNNLWSLCINGNNVMLGDNFFFLLLFSCCTYCMPSVSLACTAFC